MIKWLSVVKVPLAAGVVVDLDDTLYPERSFHDSGFRWIARRTGLNLDGSALRDAYDALRAGGRPLDVLSRATGVPVSTLLAWHRGHPPDIALYPDASRFLDSLRDARIPIVLLTDGRSVTQGNKIAALGLHDKLHAALISEKTGLPKANAAAFRNAAAHLLGRSPLYYFGDNPTKDVEHPTSLGWRVHLMLSRGDNVHAQICESEKFTTPALSTFDEVTVAHATPPSV